MYYLPKKHALSWNVYDDTRAKSENSEPDDYGSIREKNIMNNFGITTSLSQNCGITSKIINYIGYIKTDSLQTNIINCVHCNFEPGQGIDFTFHYCLGGCGFLVNVSHITNNIAKPNIFKINIFKDDKCERLCRVFVDNLTPVQKVNFRNIIDYLYKHPKKFVPLQIKCKKSVTRIIDDNTNILTNNIKMYGYKFKILPLENRQINSGKRRVTTECIIL